MASLNKEQNLQSLLDFLRSSNVVVHDYSGVIILNEFVVKHNLKSYFNTMFRDRPGQSTYTYGDVILTVIYLIIFEGGRLDQIDNLSASIPISERVFKFPSADTLARVLKSLATETVYEDNYPKVHQINYCKDLNDAIINLPRQINTAHLWSGYRLLDYDNTVIKTKKKDSQYSYAKCHGYSNGLATINGIPAALFGANGNTPAHYHQDLILIELIQEMKANGFGPTHFRADSGSWTNAVINLLFEERLEFFIRPEQDAFIKHINANTEWTYATLQTADGPRPVLITELLLEKFHRKHRIRFVVQREISGEIIAVATNNFKMSPMEVIHYYNSRGGFELKIKDLKSDLCWKVLPFNTLAHNMVFMSLAAMAYSIFLGVRMKMNADGYSGIHPTIKLSTIRATHLKASGWNDNGRIRTFKYPCPYTVRKPRRR